MILVWILVILLAGGVMAALSGLRTHLLPRWISLGAIALDLVLLLVVGIQYLNGTDISGESRWFVEVQTDWIPQFGISFHLALDGLSLLLVLLTLFLGLLSVLVSWTEVSKRVGFFHLNILWILAGITGVFLAMDLFLFYFFWEVMLIPMYFLIAIWGHEHRVYAAYKFFIFTQAGGLLMLLSILGLYFVHGQQTGSYTFDYTALLGTSLSPSMAFWLMLGFLAGFLVKLPIVPLHSWLPDAHTEAPTAGSVILAGLLLKTGAYGLLRFVVPLFPDAAADIAPYAMLLGVIGILYGAMLAFAQTDLKRLVAYTSVSHMGFVMLGVFALNELAFQGVVMQMITHGISTGALFILAGSLQERIHTRDITSMGRFWSQAPKMGAIGLLFAMASLGLPGLGNFVAEFLVLLGAYQTQVWLTVLAALGLIFSSVYALRLMQRVFYGEKAKEWELPDFSVREMMIMGSLVVLIVGLGVYPQPAIRTARPALQEILSNPRYTEKNEHHQLESSAIDRLSINPVSEKKMLRYDP